jgi:hypothetical protein
MMVQQDAPHNGWSSFETWLVNLYVTNDPGLYKWLTELVKQDISRGEKAEALQRELYDLTLPEADSGVLFPEDTSLATHLTHAALERVNWQEIIEASEEVAS